MLFKKHLLFVIVAALIFAGNNASGYMTTGGFVTTYATTDGVGFSQTDVLLAITFGSFVWLASTAVSGYLADRIGRVRTYVCGFVILIAAAFPLLWLIDTGSLGMM